MRIEGDSKSLRRLAETFVTGKHRVTVDSEGYSILESTALDNIAPSRASIQAERLIDLLNGAMRAVDSSFKAVRFGGHLRHPKYGQRMVVGRSVTLRWHRESSDPTDSHAFATHYFDLALSNPDVAEVLNFLRGSKLDWPILYKVFEVIRQNVGNEAHVVAKGWATKDEITSFKDAANRPEIGGETARHARRPGRPPEGPFLTLNRGQHLILRLAKCWMQTLLSVG